MQPWTVETTVTLSQQFHYLTKTFYQELKYWLGDIILGKWKLKIIDSKKTG